MTVNQQVQFRRLLHELILVIDRPDDVMVMTAHIERWVGQQIDQEVMRAVAPFIKVKIN